MPPLPSSRLLQVSEDRHGLDIAQPPLRAPVRDGLLLVFGVAMGITGAMLVRDLWVSGEAALRFAAVMVAGFALPIGAMVAMAGLLGLGSSRRVRVGPAGVRVERRMLGSTLTPLSAMKTELQTVLAQPAPAGRLVAQPWRYHRVVAVRGGDRLLVLADDLDADQALALAEAVRGVLSLQAPAADEDPAAQ